MMLNILQHLGLMVSLPLEHSTIQDLLTLHKMQIIFHLDGHQLYYHEEC